MTIQNSINNNLGNQLYYAQMTLNTGQITGMFASPVAFTGVVTPGANQIIVPRQWGIDLTFNSTPFTGGGSISLYYDVAKTQTTSGPISATTMNSSSSVTSTKSGNNGTISGTNSIGKSLYISNATGAFASGDSSATFYVSYSVVNFDATIVQNSVNNISGNSGFQIAELYIPSAQVQNLNTVPQTIIPAPPSGQMLIPANLISLLIYNSVNYSASTVQVIYGTSGSLIDQGGANFISGSANQFNSTTLGASYSNFSSSNGNGNSIQIKASANPGSSGNSALKIYLSYSTITL